MGREVDPITVSVVKGMYYTIAREMAVTLEQTARSAGLAIAHDSSNGIFDTNTSEVRMISQGEDLPVHLGSLCVGIKQVVNYLGEDVHPGDIFLFNDPTYGGSHLQDMCMCKPVFCEDELMFWVSTKGHLADTGGISAGGYQPLAKEIYAEGIRIPPVKICDKGKMREDVINLIVLNVRTPQVIRADYRSMVATLDLSEQGLLALVKKYGKDTIKACNDRLIDASEEEMRARIRQWPDGEYEGQAIVEDMGRGWGELKIKAKIVVGGDEVLVSIEGPGQVDGYINCYKPNSYSAIYIGVLYHTGLEPPFNEGIYRPIKVNLGQLGTVVNAVNPAACSNSTTTITETIVDAVLDAMQKIVPEKAVAGGAHLCTTCFSGRDPRRGDEPYVQMSTLFCLVGGDGATSGQDGWDACGPTESSRVIKEDAELLEYTYPIIVHRVEYVTDSGCAGKWRGGLGAIVEGEPIGHTTTLVLGGEGYVYPAKSILGATSKLMEPKVGRNYILREGKIQPLGYAFPTTSLSPGERYIKTNPGGGGVGNPFERDLEMVRQDVINEKVSIEGAKLEYGVVIDPERYLIDYEATNKLRKEHQAGCIE